ncbi:MAG TPA: N-acetylneuraminate synthase family protein [Bryobacteraceae bacterium]|nr:N-acetylneuraminate synthase family protein [Bryobacteraceae bacterium]
MQTLFDPARRRCLIIAEVAQAHDGSLGTAHAYIDAAARAGADAVKFQTHIAHAESTPGEPWRVRFSPQDASRYDYWKRMEFTETQWAGLADHARQRGLIFLSSPFSMEAVDLLERLEVAGWKVGAGEITNIPMIERMARTGRPVLLSSGMAGWTDLDAAVGAVRRAGAQAGVFQCTTAYPCPPARLGLNVLAELRERYNCPVGLSDHSGTIFAGLAAVSLGAAMLELHIVFSRECYGPDTVASVTIDELSALVKGVRFIEQALAASVDKDAMAAELAEQRRIFGKSVVAARAMAAGQQLSPGDLALKKPGFGIPANRLYDVIGCRLKRNVVADDILTEDDIDNPKAS